MDCIFCKIVAGDIPSTKVYEDEQVYAFRDIHPQAPVHILVIPKAHIPGAAALDEPHEALVGHIFTVAARIARDEGIDGGFRVLTNNGPDAGQTVAHLHFHLMGGRVLTTQMA